MSTESKPALLFLSPIMPDVSGNGLAMRAGATLEALAADHEVHLLVIPVAGSELRSATEPGEAVRRWCARILVHQIERHIDPHFGLIAGVRDPQEQLSALLAYPRPSLGRFATSASVREAAELAAGPCYQTVHVLRLYLAPFAEPYLAAREPAAGAAGLGAGAAGLGARAAGRRAVCRLDLDDYEPATRRRIAGLLRQNGDERAALVQEWEASRYEALAAAMLPRFDRVYVASAADRAPVAAQYPGADVAVLENVIRLPEPRTATPAPSASISAAGQPFTFLFVGSFGYYPNDDAARYFCGKVLPLLRAGAPGPFRVRLVGANPSAAVRLLAAMPDVTVTGPVADVTPWYQSANAVIVPVRAGGGTRIKVLEAFAHQRPVVATSAGAEGVEVTAGRHLLIADSPGDFAACCGRLMRDPALGRKLAIQGTEFARLRVPARLRECLAV
jgi:glycosyltransferase involved in cell wall biosynthesis